MRRVACLVDQATPVNDECKVIYKESHLFIILIYTKFLYRVRPADTTLAAPAGMRSFEAIEAQWTGWDEEDGTRQDGMEVGLGWVGTRLDGNSMDGTRIG